MIEKWPPRPKVGITNRVPNWQECAFLNAESFLTPLPRKFQFLLKTYPNHVSCAKMTGLLPWLRFLQSSLTPLNCMRMCSKRMCKTAVSAFAALKVLGTVGKGSLNAKKIAIDSKMEYASLGMFKFCVDISNQIH